MERHSAPLAEGLFALTVLVSALRGLNLPNPHPSPAAARQGCGLGRTGQQEQGRDEGMEQMELPMEKGVNEQGNGADERRPRCDRGPRLTTRDLDALRWLVEQRAATATQVQALLSHLGRNQVGERRTREIISRWEQLGLIERHAVWHGEPAIIWPTTTGAKLVGETRWRKPGILTLRHTITAADIRLRVAPPGSHRRWLCEAELRRLTPPGQRIADGAWIEPDGTTTAVEVELSPHGRKRVREAITSLLALRSPIGHRFQTVLYLCAPHVLTQVNAVRDELPENDKTRVVVRPVP